MSYAVASFTPVPHNTGLPLELRAVCLDLAQVLMLQEVVLGRCVCRWQWSWLHAPFLQELISNQTVLSSYPIVRVPSTYCPAHRLSTRNENVVCLPPKRLQQDGCQEAENRLCWGEDTVEKLQSQQLSSVYHQETALEKQVRQMKEEGRRRGRWEE